VVAEGGYVTGAVAPPLEDATAVQVAQAVRIGPYVMPRFSERAISDAELDSIIAYVQYAKNPDDRGGWALGHLGPVPEGLVTWLLAGAALIVFCVILGRRLRA
jgi:ubiquinol-cytochrome c reductase cytochrome c subunit